jgi:adenosylmethionine-8-amino-7-oxononanoate aminotransferase
MDLNARDRKVNWHPYTQMKDTEELPLIPIVRAQGVYLYDASGKAYFDTVSSWWCNIHGHGHPHIVAELTKQAAQLDHVLFAGFTHEPAIRLSEKLVALAPRGMGKVFYSDNGSTAIEIAMKMSFQYWRNICRPGKQRFICLDGGYHGDTIGTMSVSGTSGFHGTFADLCFAPIRVASPDCYRCTQKNADGCCACACVAAVEDALREHGEQTAAMLIEPLVMGAGGMRMYPPAYLSKVRELTSRYGVHLIADEVAVGFGRTGTMFACEQADITPDFLCLSKGLTNGMLPFAATMLTDEVYDAFYDDYEKGKTFFHGHTFTANPIGCAVALASLELFESERTLDRAKEAANVLAQGAKEFYRHDAVGDVRVCGHIAAFELVNDRVTKEPYSRKPRIGKALYERGLVEGIILRPLGHVMYLYLPLVMTPDQVREVLMRTDKVFADVLPMKAKG